MDGTIPNPAEFTHVRIIVGMVTGLTVARLLNGLARFVQNPNRNHLYLVHIGWSLFLLLAIIHFWWFEFALSRIGQWTFEQYLFVISYAAFYFFISAVLYPDKMEGYFGFEDYFSARKKWIYGLLALLFAADIVDSAIKGSQYFSDLGLQYPVRQVLLIALCLIAMRVTSRHFHQMFVFSALASQVWWIIIRFEILR